MLDAARDAGNRWLFTDAGEPWSGTRFVAFLGSDLATHGVDVGDWIDKGVESLEAHRTYLDGLPPGTPGTEPESFLRGMAEFAGPRLGVELAVTFEIITL